MSLGTFLQLETASMEEAISGPIMACSNFVAFMVICFNSNQAQKNVAATMIRYLGQMFPETW